MVLCIQMKQFFIKINMKTLKHWWNKFSEWCEIYLKANKDH
jgi:hypothetical protein